MLEGHKLLFAAQVGARGKDEWGAMFASSMKRSAVGINKMRVQQGQTGYSPNWTHSSLLLCCMCSLPVHFQQVRASNSIAVSMYCLVLDDHNCILSPSWSAMFAKYLQVHESMIRTTALPNMPSSLAMFHPSLTHAAWAAGRCVIFISNGQRTMRTCLGEAARMAANDLSVEDFKGAKWLLLSGYCFYGVNLLQRAVELALQAGVKVALDLASFEIVQSFKPQLRKILESGKVHCCFCNEVITLLQLPPRYLLCCRHLPSVKWQRLAPHGTSYCIPA